MSSNSSLTDSHEHTSVTGYLMVFAALMVLTVLTVAVSRLNLGLAGNAAVALVIAISKASLVLYYFMHLKESAKVITVVAVGGFAWLLILFAFTIADFLSMYGDGGSALPQALPW